LEDATVPFVAWEFEDPEGERWLIQFSIAGLTNDVLAAGDIVDFTSQIDPGSFERPEKGLVALERDGRPVIALGIDEAPLGVQVEAAEAVCPAYEELQCFVERAARITVADETAVVPIGELAELGGLTIANGYLADFRDCDVPDGMSLTFPGYPLDFELGVFLPR
jgi:hypothetical protein